MTLKPETLEDALDMLLKGLWYIVRNHDLECRCPHCNLWRFYFTFKGDKWVFKIRKRGIKADFEIPLWEYKA